jgi:hypothetical protein
VAAAGQDHRKRILEHQERMKAEQNAPTQEPTDRQLKMPLIGEVPRVEEKPRSKRKRARPNRDQLKL